MLFRVTVTGHDGYIEMSHPSMITEFQAASVALRVCGTDLDTGFINVETILGDFEEFEFVRIDDMLAIV
jgi:hypothetical protein